MLFRSDVVVIVGGAGLLIVIDSAFVAVCWGLPESLTLKVGDDVPVVVGIPVITPDGLRVRPAGSTPLDMSHVFVPVPPVAVNVKV